MKLLNLQMHNFRQFYGTTPVINFAGTKKNVTVIHAENGAGKTALLNAFTWILYDEHTKGFGAPEEKVNKRALAEASLGTTVNAWVKLSFEHDGIIYQIKRETEAVKVSEEEWSNKPPRSAKLSYADEGGGWKEQNKVFETLGRILPKDLHYYFFFDGERIERIVQPSAREKKDLAAAAKKLLGVEVIDRSITHLKDAHKILEKELGEIGDPETQQLLEEKATKEQQAQELDDKLEQLQSNIDAFKDNKREVESRLRALEGVKHLQKRRDDLNEDLDSRKNSLHQTHEKLQKLIAEDGYTIFVQDTALQFQKKAEELRERGELPVGIKQQFVQDILDHGTCICNRTLLATEDPSARKAVEEWMQKAGSDDVEKAANDLCILIEQMQEKVPEFWEKIGAFDLKTDADRSEIASIEIELDEIKKQLVDNPREEVSSLEKRLSTLESDIDSATHDKGATSREKEDLEAEITALQTEISQHQGKEEKQQLANRRVRAAWDALERLGLVYSNLNEILRHKFEKHINKCFHQISVSPYEAKLDWTFSLELFDPALKSPIPIASSQGESQVLCLSFIAGFVELAKEWSAKQKGNQIGPESIEYPIVMDSPFGALDTTNRRRVAEHINRIADQVIMMVSSTQWQGEVQGASAGKVGSSYVLSYHTPNNDFKEKVSTEINGETYDLVRKSSNAYEYTEIIEVENG